MPSRFLPPLAAFLFLVSTALAPTGAGHSQSTLTYLALGDSLAFGVGADSPAAQGYVGLTVSALAEAGNEVSLHNLSVPGATSADLLHAGGQVEQALADIDALGDGVDIISIDIGANDLLALADSDSPCTQDASSKACLDALGQTLSTLQTNLSTALHQLRAASPDAKIYVVDVYNPYSGTGDPRELIASVGVQQLNGVISAASNDPTLEATFVDVHDVFEGRALQWIASDGIHPNNDGYRVMAEALLAAIEERTPVLPSDLAALPSAPGAVTETPEGDSGVDSLVPAVGIPAAFLAGMLLSAAYFVIRGRR